jgi:hypothetical protein
MTYRREAELRRAKAEAIAAALRQARADAQIAATFTPRERRLAAKVAGQRPPSEQTWAEVVELLRQPA